MKKLNFKFFIKFLFLSLCYIVSYNVSAQPLELNETSGTLVDKKLLTAGLLKEDIQPIVNSKQLSSSKNIVNEQRFTVLVSQGKQLILLSRYEEAINMLVQAKAIALSFQDLALEAETNLPLGVAYYYQGELALSLTAYQQALLYLEEKEKLELENKELPIKKANLLNNMALVHDSMGNNTQSLFYYQKAESLYQQYGNEQDKVDVRFNIALLHVNLKRFDMAITMLKEVVINFGLLGDDYSVAKATAGLGVAYKHSGKYELAKKYTLKGLKYFEDNKYLHDTASELHNASTVYIYLFDYEKSIEYAKKAIALSKKLGHQKAYAGGLKSIAKAYLYQGKLQLAQESIALSSLVAKKIGYKTTFMDNLAISALISSALGQHSKGVAEFFAYERYQNEIDNILLNEQLAKFESEQLAQQVIQLKQKRKLSELKATKALQQRNFILIAVVLFLLLALSIYRRYLESSLTSELEKRVFQRTKELELTTKDLQKANKVKSQFLANMSHEIRTPLTSIVGHAEAIIHNDIDKKHLTNEVDIIHGNSLHLLELINDILDLSKIEADKFELEIRPQNVEDIIQELSNMFNEQALKKGLFFSIEHKLQFPFIIHTDGRRLRQVLINLCSNAIKFTPQGSVTLNVKLIEDQLAFTVTDTGIGLTDDQRAQIFEIFAQADSSISRRFGGSGLGLSLSNQLANLMGGNITVESTLTKGSSFCFVIPFKQGIPFSSNINGDSLIPQFNSKKNNLSLNEVFKLRKFSGKILLAEDHDDNRRLIARLLEGIGLDVLTATNGFEAIEMCLEHNPPLILLDIQMPEMDGITAFSKLRELGFQQPIYAITANAMSHEISQYLALGFTGHLKKPIERISFINTISKYYDDISSLYSSEKVHKLNQTDADNCKNDSEVKINFEDLIIDFKKGLTTESKLLSSYFEDRNKAHLAIVVHRVSGAGQMFGFTELGQIARELDIYLKSISIAPITDNLKEQEKQNDFIEGLTNCLIDEISVVQSN